MSIPTQITDLWLDSLNTHKDIRTWESFDELESWTELIKKHWPDMAFDLSIYIPSYPKMQHKSKYINSIKELMSHPEIDSLEFEFLQKLLVKCEERRGLTNKEVAILVWLYEYRLDRRFNIREEVNQ